MMKGHLKLNNINFFRILFTLIIIYGHIIQHYMMPMFGNTEFYQHLKVSYSFGYMCDMFFIISGFFMFFTFLKDTSFKKFVISKFARLQPVLIASFVGILILSLIIPGVHYFKYQNLLGLFFLDDSFAANFLTNNGCAWYINVMFWGYIFYYCLTRIIPKDKINYAIGLITFFAYGILFNKMELYAQPQIWQEGFLTIPMIRALAGMGLGYIIGNIYNNTLINNLYAQTQNKSKTFLYTVLEFVSLWFLFRFAIIKWYEFNFPVMMILFIILFYLFLTQKGYLSRLFDNKLCFMLGKYCFSIYLMQEVMFIILNETFWKPYATHLYQPIVISISVLAVCLFGIMIYYTVERPFAKLYNKLLKD